MEVVTLGHRWGSVFLLAAQVRFPRLPVLADGIPVLLPLLHHLSVDQARARFSRKPRTAFDDSRGWARRFHAPTGSNNNGPRQSRRQHTSVTTHAVPVLL